MSRRVRSATSHALLRLRACRYDADIVDDFTFPIGRKVDSSWNYD